MPRPQPLGLGVACTRCSAQPGHRCTSPNGRHTNTHTVRLAADYTANNSPEDQSQREHEARMFDAQYNPRTLVQLSFGYSCGCTDSSGEPIPLGEANTAGVARAIICDRHDEYAVIIRVTTRLVADEATLKRVLLAADVGDREVDGENYTVDSIAAEQCDANRAKVRAGDPTAVRYTIY